MGVPGLSGLWWGMGTMVGAHGRVILLILWQESKRGRGEGWSPTVCFEDTFPVAWDFPWLHPLNNYATTSQ